MLSPDNLEDFFRFFTIRQGSKIRKIEAPVEPLKSLQKSFLPILEKVRLHPACFSRRGKTIADMAAPHSNAVHLLKIDLKTCFRYITRDSFLRECPDLEEIADYCFLWKNGESYLPTGSPTSPAICNIALTSLDKKVSKAAKGYTYTRYVDDLCLSITTSERRWNLLEEVVSLIREEGLLENRKKCLWSQTKIDISVVTGVRLGTNSGITRSYKRNLRVRLNNVARSRGEIDSTTEGMLSYVKFIDPVQHLKLLEYLERRREYEPASE